jgi:UDP-N-acetylmuramoyl-L-alanyl-D-glutamate--2,6-diaminopimelate ligase
MKLSELLCGLPDLGITADPSLEILAVAYDSRRAVPGTLFFAIQGGKADGHDFIRQAFERGAAAVVSERSAPEPWTNRWVRVPRIRRALSQVSRAFFGHPENRLQLIGVTGTNGKTTTSYLLESILQAADISAGLFGTIEYRVGHRTLTASNTTPESLDLADYLAELVASGGQAAVMEVSSHALAQERVWGFPFAAAVFTNLTRDHLDYHGDLEHYFHAKRRLFEGLGTPPPGLAVINADDPRSAELLHLSGSRFLTFGMNSGAQVSIKQFTQGPQGLRAALSTPAGRMEIESPLLGRANLSNILAATATAIGLGVAEKHIQEGVSNLKLVPGRFERIDEGQPFWVIVDYAHTDDALRNVLGTARELATGRLIVVFGCGGDRDRSKRPLMGEAASSLSDLVVLTSDNPRSEDPLDIMNDARVGLQRTGKPYLLEVDREPAIRKALEQARAGDVVVIAGKGHETGQIMKDRVIPFDDREAARRILHELDFRRSA